MISWSNAVSIVWLILWLWCLWAWCCLMLFLTVDVELFFSCDPTVGRCLSDGPRPELVFWLMGWSTSGLLSWDGGSLIAFTTFGLVCTLESPVTRGGSSHFILAMKSIISAFICGSNLSLSVLVCGAGLFELRFWFGPLNILLALLVKFGSLKTWSRASVRLQSAIWWRWWFSPK